MSTERIMHGFSCSPENYQRPDTVRMKLADALMMCGNKYHEMGLIGQKIIVED